MQKLLHQLLVVSILTSFIGCGSSQTPEPSQQSAAQQNLNAPAVATSDSVSRDQGSVIPGADSASPSEIVREFLSSLRDGNKRVAEGLLTQRAREETRKRDLAVQPPGTPNAKYEIQGVKYVSEAKTGAHVQSLWMEPDADGSSITYEITWVLRKQSDGWRIAGMATQLVPDERPLFLNFEDPDDMLAKWENADQALNEQETREARLPAKSPKTLGQQ